MPAARGTSRASSGHPAAAFLSSVWRHPPQGEVLSGMQWAVARLSVSDASRLVQSQLTSGHLARRVGDAMSLATS